MIPTHLETRETLDRVYQFSRTGLMRIVISEEVHLASLQETGQAEGIPCQSASTAAFLTKFAQHQLSVPFIHRGDCASISLLPVKGTTIRSVEYYEKELEGRFRGDIQRVYILAAAPNLVTARTVVSLFVNRNCYGYLVRIESYNIPHKPAFNTHSKVRALIALVERANPKQATKIDWLNPSHNMRPEEAHDSDDIASIPYYALRLRKTLKVLDERSKRYEKAGVTR